jgi:DNA (cytosine-5)-methyltransferase 1
MPVTHHGGSDRARDAATDPLPTVTGANRGALHSSPRSSASAMGIPAPTTWTQPASTGATLGHGALMEGIVYFDILFRMLEPHELAGADGLHQRGSDLRVRRHQDAIRSSRSAMPFRVSKMKACVGASDGRRRAQEARTSTPCDRGGVEIFRRAQFRARKRRVR